MTGSARRLAIDALLRIDTEGGYANLVVPSLLERSRLSERDRGFVTTLVYGTTRMRRACDWLVDRFLMGEVEPGVRAALRLGAYQLAFLRTPPHAAVSETVGAAPKRVRGLVNAVLRRVAEAPRDWPDDATRLSYPDWIVDRFRSELGDVDGLAALEAMDEPADVHLRQDGYVQDPASQWVAELVDAGEGDRVADLAAAPGGKATWMAHTGAWVAASDVSGVRAGLVAGNARRLGHEAVAVVTADGRRPPYRDGVFDCVLLDAPCSGLGVLRRRPDARWRVTEDAVARLARLQRELVEAGVALVRPGGTFVYSVCTLTREESSDIDAWLARSHPDVEPVEPPPAPWEPYGRGARLLPQVAGTDGMCVFRYRRRP